MCRVQGARGKGPGLPRLARSSCNGACGWGGGAFCGRQRAGGGGSRVFFLGRAGSGASGGPLDPPDTGERVGVRGRRRGGDQRTAQGGGGQLGYRCDPCWSSVRCYRPYLLCTLTPLTTRDPDLKSNAVQRLEARSCTASQEIGSCCDQSKQGSGSLCFLISCHYVQKRGHNIPMEFSRLRICAC